MRVLLTIISCILLIIFGPKEEIDEICARVTTWELAHSADLYNCLTSESIHEDGNIALWAVFGCSCGTLNNELNGLCTFVRYLSVRIQFRFQSKMLYMKKLSGLLLKRLVNQDTCISPHFSTHKIYAWQHAVDCYVFALRHIVI